MAIVCWWKVLAPSQKTLRRPASMIPSRTTGTNAQRTAKFRTRLAKMVYVQTAAFPTVVAASGATQPFSGCQSSCYHLDLLLWWHIATTRKVIGEGTPHSTEFLLMANHQPLFLQFAEPFVFLTARIGTSTVSKMEAYWTPSLQFPGSFLALRAWRGHVLQTCHYGIASVISVGIGMYL